ncbi:hypothetical protein CYME_CMT468C [Cyanidioschyzon merolae strain 10D]|uniref:Uncharacterized protein n=1 Tax=Cyanidioschyzon merolae (strain NIES-3377 / 10D) TaxID=280699 RepID=M1VCW5_CYAM1|nr:hypothetical protein CYME_CMT468C [Cyanidioschyzon merolae strain 10D]BAM83399.1 hypothetical protein CYME_CMT468C [Cyanidioschyzon merolae strain 10D]|eukprot:XP_005539435.1 hypothetical protein CYME_CMT468C [Cyanidioschyzon merolae strain 10D]
MTQMPAELSILRATIQTHHIKMNLGCRAACYIQLMHGNATKGVSRETDRNREKHFLCAAVTRPFEGVDVLGPPSDIERKAKMKLAVEIAEDLKRHID